MAQKPHWRPHSSVAAALVALLWLGAYEGAPLRILAMALVGPLLGFFPVRRGVAGVFTGLLLAPAALAPWHASGDLGGPSGFVVDLGALLLGAGLPWVAPVLLGIGVLGAWRAGAEHGLPASAPLGDTQGHPVLVFGIDGADWQVIEGMAGELPTLSSLAARGRKGVLRSEEPMASPVAWTTIFSGVHPNTHGVSDWNHSDARSRRVPLVWDAAAAQGQRAVVVNVPGTWPPERLPGGVSISGFPMPGFATGDTSNLAGWVAQVGEVVDLGGAPFQPRLDWLRNPLLETARREGFFPGFAWTVPEGEGWVELPEIGARVRLTKVEGGTFVSPPVQDARDPRVPFATGEAGDLSGYVVEGVGWTAHRDPRVDPVLPELIFEVQERQARQFEALLPADLAVFVFTATDRAQHPWFATRPEVVAEAYRRADAALARAMARMPADTLVFVVSDHGVSAEDPRHRRDLGESGHRAEGVWIAAGPGVAPGPDVEMGIVDLLPTLLACMGAALPDDLEGAAASVCLTPGRRAPGGQVWTWRVEDHGSAAPALDPSQEAQLRSLGYVD